MKKSELRKIIREEIQQIRESVTIATTTRGGRTYADYDEYARPAHVIIRMTNGKKLRIARQFGGKGAQIYQAILQALDSYTDNPKAKNFLDKVVNSMADNLDAKTESINSITEADMIKNPDTGRKIKVSSALSYPKDSAAYKLAAKHLKKKTDNDIKGNKKPASLSNDKILGQGSAAFKGPKSDSESFIGDARKQRYVNRFINKIADESAKARAAGKPAPNFNLCEISVPGTNLFCQKEMGIPREKMPQLKGNPIPGSIADKLPKSKSREVDTEEAFKKYLIKKGHKLENKSVDVLQLKASQSELVGAKVAGMRKALEELPPEQTKAITAPIFVSRDGYILDGHHRWAAMVGLSMGKEKKTPPIMMDVITIDMDAKDMIDVTNKFTEKIGIRQKDASTEKGN